MIAKRMKLGFSGKVRSVGALGAIEKSKIMQPSVRSYSGLKLLSYFMPSNPNKSGCVALVCRTLILAIFSVVSFTKIAKSIVVFNLVNVVYLFFRPSTVDVQPSKSMGFVRFRPDSDNVIPAAIFMSGRIPSVYAICRTSNPSKKSSLRAIVQNFAQSFGGNVCRIFDSHDAPPVRWDQGPGRVGSACLASPY